MRLSKMIHSLKYGLRHLSGKAAMAIFLTASAAQADRITIVALGDSLTQGYGLPQWEGFTEVLEDWLTAQGVTVQINNAGVSGDTTAGGLERAEWALYGDIQGVIIAFGGNDMLRGFPPELVQENLGKIIEFAQGYELEVLLVGMKATLNYGQDYKDKFDAVYPTLAAEYDVQLYPDFIGAISNDRTMAEIQEFMQGDGLHPSAEGVQMIVEDFGPVVMGMIEEIGQK